MTAKKQSKEKIPRGRAKDTIEDLNADDMLTSGKPWTKPRQRKKKESKLPESILKCIEEMAKNFKPRDPTRIPKILNVLKELWELEPDTRLGQLLLNFAFRGGDHKEKTNYLMYEQEDNVTLAALEKTLKKEKRSRKIR